MTAKKPAFNWDDLRFLLAVYRTGTMSAAARELGTNVATVSRRMDRLAEELGGNPFIKTPSGWRPSPEIGGLLAAATSFEGQMQNLAGVSEAPGTLPRIRLGAEACVIARFLIPHLVARTSPIGRIDLELVQRTFDTSLGAHDVIIRDSEAASEVAMSRPLGSVRFGIYRWRGVPQTNRWIGLSEAHEQSPAMARAHALFQCGPVLRLGDYEKLFNAAKLLRLPALLPEPYALAEPQMIRIDPVSDAPVRRYWVVYRRSRMNDAATQIVVDWVADAFGASSSDQLDAANSGR